MFEKHGICGKCGKVGHIRDMEQEIYRYYSYDGKRIKKVYIHKECVIKFLQNKITEYKED